MASGDIRLQDMRRALESAAPAVPRTRSLLKAIRWTVLYASIFDYPLTRDELTS
jgi:hypothetical protein